jgi:hypothetical protein
VTIFTLESFTRDADITLRSGVAVTDAVRRESTGTRLHARVLFTGSRLVGPVLATADLAMMRKQLKTLKSLAERPT